MIAIIDYGMGNIHSVQKALESFGEKTRVVNQPKEIRECKKLVLPGVGAFSDAMRELKEKDLISAIKEELDEKKIFLGICLGMQLLFEESQEPGGQRGLGMLRGEVKKFKSNLKQKVPHMGWNQLKVQNKDCPLLKGVVDKSFVYFCHSYYPAPKDKDIICATTDYGIDFTSIIWQDNIYGTQFHPEKSQDVGMQILKNFVELC